VIDGEEPVQSLYERSLKIPKYQDITLDLKPFGYDFFRDAAFRVITERKDIPVPMNYTVGPGDEVRISLWGRVNATYNLTVSRDGKITIPTLGPLVVAGQTFEQMSQYLTKQAEQMTGTNVDVTMGSLRTIPIFVLGDVRRPGAYTIGSFATITDALLLAGGPTGIGTMRNIQLKRRDVVIQTFDLYDLLLKGDKSKDVTLSAGDIIFVPVIGPYVGVAGNVKRPALYELKNNFSLEYLFELAGGIIPTAYTQQIQVERTIRNEKKVIVDIDDKKLDRTKSTFLQDADLVKVFSIVEKDTNSVTLKGNVKRGGKYAFNPGMRLGDILKDPLLDLKPETHFDYALIKRQNPPHMEPLLVPFNLGDLLLRHDPASNLELRPLDSIYIFSKWFFRDKPFVTVKGEVRNPGRIDLQENFKVKDALLAAGDLTKDAYLRKGEIVRVNKEKEYQTLYFDVTRALADDPLENVLIKDEDQVFIHSLYEEQWREQVTVAGEVKKPGDFLLTDKMTVRDLVFKAGGQSRNTLLARAELYRTDWKTKEVTLTTVYLGKALEGDPASNIELRDLDKLVVHSTWEMVYKKKVFIDGDVLKPGGYQFAENMTVRDLVFAAGNILESAAQEDAEIASQILNPKNESTLAYRNINLALALANDPAHNLALRPYDRLLIKRIPDWQRDRYMTLEGEVRFPGKYAIKKGEKLSSLLERAGGYKDSAYYRGAFFTRESVRELQQQSLQEMAERMERETLSTSTNKIATATSPEELAIQAAEGEQQKKFIEGLRKLKATGRMSIYLEDLSLLKGSEYDIALEDGDSLSIPQKSSVVNVTGSVMVQGSYIYLDKLDYEGYIRQTGGYSSHADKGKIYVMKVDGSAWKLSGGGGKKQTPFGKQIKPIEPGDTIIVPEKISSASWMKGIKDMTQVLMNIAVTAGVALQF
jgi:protein involved in polysaccharide export with SLBB domain